jgi:hypothetical protein
MVTNDVIIAAELAANNAIDLPFVIIQNLRKPLFINVVSSMTSIFLLREKN